MRQLTFVKPKVLEWHDVLAPRLDGPRQAVVAPVAATTCDLDRSIMKGRAPFGGPIALGHIRPHLGAVLSLVQRGRVAPEEITSETLPRDDLPQALSEPSMKPVFVRSPN